MARTRKSKSKRVKRKKHKSHSHSHRRNSNRKIRENVKVYGHVYSDMCIHCENMKNEWATFITRMKKSHETVVLKDIGENHEAEMQLLNQEFNIDLKSVGYPTIFRIIEGKAKQYEVDYYSGERTAGSMMKWLTSKKKQVM